MNEPKPLSHSAGKEHVVMTCVEIFLLSRLLVSQPLILQVLYWSQAVIFCTKLKNTLFTDRFYKFYNCFMACPGIICRGACGSGSGTFLGIRITWQACESRLLCLPPSFWSFLTGAQGLQLLARGLHFASPRSGIQNKVFGD